MSEPYSAVLQVTIVQANLIAYLSQKPAPASGWSDWAQLGGSFDYNAGLPKLLASVDRRLTGTYHSCLKTLLNPVTSMSRLQYDHSSGTFTYANLMFSENLEEIIRFLALCRGLSPFIGAAAGGYASVHDYLWDHRNITVLGLSAHGSGFLNNPQHVHAYEANINRGVAVLDRMIDEGDDYNSTVSHWPIENLVH